MAVIESQRQRNRAGAVVLVVVGSIVALIALAVLAAGGSALWADKTQRDSAGYFTSSTHRFAADSYAITHEGVDLHDLPGWMDRGRLAHVRLRATGERGRPVFIGIARERDVRAYLAGVAYDQVADVHLDPFSARYDEIRGSQPPAA